MVRVEKERGGKQGWCSGRRRGFSERVSRGRPVRGLRIPKEHGFTSFNAKGQCQWVVGQPHEPFATGRAGRRSESGAEGGGELDEAVFRRRESAEAVDARRFCVPMGRKSVSLTEARALCLFLSLYVSLYIAFCFSASNCVVYLLLLLLLFCWSTVYVTARQSSEQVSLVSVDWFGDCEKRLRLSLLLYLLWHAAVAIGSVEARNGVSKRAQRCWRNDFFCDLPVGY